MKQYLALLLFITLTVLSGIAIGYATMPGEWYLQLIKPDFTPPGWVFGPIWTFLYMIIGISGWCVWKTQSYGRSMKLWWAQLTLNFFWSPIFFSLHKIGIAFVIILLLFVTVVEFIRSTWRHNHTAALLFIPYAAWLGFASILNGYILVLN